MSRTQLIAWCIDLLTIMSLYVSGARSRQATIDDLHNFVARILHQLHNDQVGNE